MARSTGFAAYTLGQIKRLTIARISQVGHRAYGQWSFYLNGYHYVVESLKTGLEDLLAAQKDPSAELAPIMKIDATGISKVEGLEPFTKVRFAPDKHNVILVRRFVQGENLWEIEMGQASAVTKERVVSPTEMEVAAQRLELSEKYIAPWRKGLSGILAAMRGEF
jgi:hypothetical protein